MRKCRQSVTAIFARNGVCSQCLVESEVDVARENGGDKPRKVLQRVAFRWCHNDM